MSDETQGAGVSIGQAGNVTVVSDGETSPGALAAGAARAIFADLDTAVGRAAVAQARAGDLGPLVGELIADSKPFWQSKTVWALVVATLGGVAARYGHPLDAKAQASLVADILNALPVVLQYGGLAAAALFHAISGKKLR